MSSATCDACQRILSRSPGKRVPRSLTPPHERPPRAPCPPVFPRPATRTCDSGDAHAQRSFPSAGECHRPVQSRLRCSPRLSTESIPAVHRPTQSSVRCYSRPRLRENTRSCPAMLRQPLRQQAAGAALGGGDGGIVQGQDVAPPPPPSRGHLREKMRSASASSRNFA